MDLHYGKTCGMSWIDKLRKQDITTYRFHCLSQKAYYKRKKIMLKGSRLKLPGSHTLVKMNLLNVCVLDRRQKSFFVNIFLTMFIPTEIYQCYIINGPMLSVGKKQPGHFCVP